MLTARFFILDSITHAMDGIYTDRHIAEEQLTYMRERYPAGRWSVCEVLSGDIEVTDKFFHVYRLREKE